ncbi:hypothetical protein Efla_007052 [Eimeria flavescens]
MARPPRKVAFFHFDVGIGGAEQLVLQAALQVQKLLRDPDNSNPRVDIFTTYHDPNRCLETAKCRELKVTVFGSFLPRLIFNRFCFLCSILRMVYLILAAFITGHRGYDIVFNDQLAVVNPLLRLIGKKVVFYGHFPEALSSPAPRSILFRLYRHILDKLESTTTAKADLLLVNSRFTAEAFMRVFPGLRTEHMRILYPAIDAQLEKLANNDNLDSLVSADDLHGFDVQSPFVLSVNRFDINKKFELAIRAVASLPPDMPCNLVIAGGYDARLMPTVEYFHQLEKLALELNFRVLGGAGREGSLANRDQGKQGRRCLLFLKNMPATMKFFLMKKSICLMYTPDGEPFGIVSTAHVSSVPLPLKC